MSSMYWCHPVLCFINKSSRLCHWDPLWDSRQKFPWSRPYLKTMCSSSFLRSTFSGHKKVVPLLPPLGSHIQEKVLFFQCLEVWKNRERWEKKPGICRNWSLVHLHYCDPALEVRKRKDINLHHQTTASARSVTVPRNTDWATMAEATSHISH